MSRLWICLLLAFGCSKNPDCAIEGTISRRFVLDSLALPQNRMAMAYDLNGDGRNDNQLGNVVAVLLQQGWIAQENVDDAIRAGTFAPVLELITTDAELRNSAGTGAIFGDGHDEGVFCGDINDTQYNSV